MGCVCRSAPNENEIKFGSSQIKTSIIKPNPNDPNNSKEAFKEKLLEYGDYITQNNFNELISKEIQNYMNENPLKINSENLNKDNVFEIEPIKFKNGNIYQGFWNQEFKMDGRGKYYLEQDKVFAEGNWDDGDLIYGRVFLPNGDIYEGEIKNSQFHGKGKLKTNNYLYEGDFLNGEKTGNGKIIFSDETIYDGNLINGEFKGNGHMTWKNGYEYDGEFDGPLLNGKGKLKCPEGDYYEGDFENNLFHGKGKYHFGENKSEYDGEFQYGIKKGKGIYITDQYTYDGYWDNDLPCGIGKLINTNNNVVLKSTWRYGIIVEEPKFLQGSDEDFKKIDLNIKPKEMILNTKDLPHLDPMETENTQYKLGNSLSFLAE